MLQNLISQGDWQFVDQLLLINSTEELIVVVLEKLPDFNIQVFWQACFGRKLLERFKFILWILDEISHKLTKRFSELAVSFAIIEVKLPITTE